MSALAVAALALAVALAAVLLAALGWVAAILRGGPDPLRRLLAAVRVELDRRAEPSSPEPKLGREAHRG